MKATNNIIRTTKRTNSISQIIKQSYFILLLLLGSASSLYAQSASVPMNHTAFSSLAVLGAGSSGYLANNIKAFDSSISKQKLHSDTFDKGNKKLDKDLFTVFRTGLPKDNFPMITQPKCWLECLSSNPAMFKKVYVFGYTLQDTSSQLSFKEANLTNNSLLVFRF